MASKQVKYKPLSQSLRCHSIYRSVLMLLVGCICNFAQATDTLRLYSRGDFNAEYAIGLIKLGLDKTDYLYKLDVVSSSTVTEDRIEKELIDGTLDIMWSATTVKKEQLFLPVRIPLFKGLLGNRAIIVHEDNKTIFANVKTLEDLRKFTFGQGRNWADTEILRANGLKVENGTYQGLFMMTDGKRFDGFPRGIHEPYAEIQKYPDLKLAVDENILLIYKMPFYLFVTPKKPELAEALHKGLMQAIYDGSFDNYFYGNPFIVKTLANSNIKQRTVIELKNPGLPPETPVDNPLLWMDLSKIK